MGGDLAGKELVPIVARNGSWTARFRGTDFSLDTLEEVAEFERRVATMGPYTLRTSRTSSPSCAPTRSSSSRRCAD